FIVKAQSYNYRYAEKRKLRFGVYVAPTTSWMRPTTQKAGEHDEFRTENDGNKLGFIYGLMMDYQFGENYFFSTGLQVNMTGGKINVTRDPFSSANNTINKANFDYSLQYIELPVALKLRTDLIGGF